MGSTNISSNGNRQQVIRRGPKENLKEHPFQLIASKKKCHQLTLFMNYPIQLKTRWSIPRPTAADN